MVSRDDDAAPPGFPLPLHELGTRVMNEVWARDEVTVREVLAAVNDGADKQLAYTTIMTIMGRLHRRGMLSRERRGRTDVYRAALSRDDYVGLRARAEVEALVEQFGDTALAHFADQVESLDPERRAALKRLADRD